MAAPHQIGTAGTRILAPLITALGVLIIVRTLTAGGGPLSIGVLLGLIFVGLGAGRLYLSMRASS